MQSIIFPRDFDPTIVLWRRAKEPSKTGYIEPGSLWENGYCESFHGRMRDELLNGEIFCSLHEAQIIIERWRTSYTTKGLHAPSSRWTKDQIQSDYLQMPVHWLTAPSGACQHPALLWYDTVDNQTVLQSDSEHLSRCSCLRHVLIGALVRKWTSVWGCHSIPINYC